MKKALKLLFYLLLFVGITVGVGLSYIYFGLPDVGNAPEIKVSITPDRVKRGSYLANHVMLCMDCHSTRDWTLFSGPMVSGTEGRGGEIFDQGMGLPGRYVSPNITPFHLKDWTDGEIFRAITTGVSKDGHALFPIMPYKAYREADSMDIVAVIAYLRTLKPIAVNQDKSKSDFPMNFIVNLMPEKAALRPIPDTNDILKYGKYMAVISGCQICHTKEEQGKAVGQPFAGGNEYKMPDGSKVYSVNITPDKETGIGNWSKEEFVARFKVYKNDNKSPEKVGKGDFQTIMPWTMYADKETKDLEAIYAYLQSLPPVNNKVIKYSPPPDK
ncbi:MAG: cytochrome C [Bacteroidetes bacterium]|jgi:mono/diheme cytochrome c family protein|nr:cytochrome C [Bacteroidota bacterium]MCB0603632.1 hypothetical protein [Saprospiraceae bacterium]MCO5277333.1 hypothetical protein [Saprospiraceae bacterium]